MSKSAWDIIANYETHDLVRIRYHAKHRWEPNTALTREIAAPFTLARHYYNAAAIADRTVKPLLLYYGVLSLSRGLVLFLTRKLRDSALAQSHGLSVSDWQSVLAADKPDLTHLKIQVNGSGSFFELLCATGNRGLLRIGSSAINHKTEGGKVPSGSSLAFGELLASLPDLIGQYRRWKVPRCFTFSTSPVEGSSNFLITVPRWQGSHIDENAVLEIVGNDNGRLVSIDDKNVVVQASKLDGMLTDLIGSDFAKIGDVYIARRYASGARLNKIAQLFAVSYILSMLVRYYPSFWMDLVNQRIGDAAVPSVSGAIDIIESLFPSIVVDFLEEQ